MHRYIIFILRGKLQSCITNDYTRLDARSQKVTEFI